jgi:hypothetical protein
MLYVFVKAIQKILFFFVPEETRYRLTQGSRQGCFTLAKALIEPLIVFTIIALLSMLCGLTQKGC